MSPVSGTETNGNQSVLVAAVLGIMALLILPLPTFALDVLLSLNVSVSILVLLIALTLKRPLEFTVFPALLLITTLFRLGLNVSTTRVILMNGSEGSAAAGQVIETFGQFAVGGSYIIGAVVFAILLVVNFTVITKGSNRIAEVSARFALDALPGKQMSIDADISAGLITEDEAKVRRKELESEIEFNGAMDGASKFVRGDAIAGLAITGINILGGIAVGVVRDGMDVMGALETYTVLTIGDGLVSQIPSILISVGAGIVVTRGGAERLNMTRQFGLQMFGNPDALTYLSAVLLGFGLVPGMPLVPFAAFGVGSFLLGRRVRRQNAQSKKKPTAAPKPSGPDRMQDLIALDDLELEVGHGLLSLIDPNQGGELPDA